MEATAEMRAREGRAGVYLGSGPGLERLRDAALLALALVTCVLAYRAFRGFVFEDAYITYRYAENLAGGRGFAFNPGERVLGTTTPLYALLLAALARAGADVPTAGTLLSVASIAGVAVAGAWILRRRSHPDLGVAFAVLTLWGGFATYYLTGMETAFFSLLLLGSALAVWSRRFVLAGIVLGLAFLLRYDAVVFAGPLLLLACLSERARRGGWRAGARGPLVSALVAAAVAAPWLVFATAYFGSPLPNTLAAKQSLTPPDVYLWESAKMFPRHLFPPLAGPVGLAIPPLHVAFALALLAPIPFQLTALARAWKGTLLFLLHPLLLWLAYAWIGSSLCIWHVVPAFFSLSLLALLAWGSALSRVSAPFRPAWASLALLAASFALLPANLREQSEKMRSTESYHRRERGYEELASWMRSRGLLDLVVCIDEPGYFTHLTDCRVVDRMGLVTAGVRPEDALAELAAAHGVQALVTREAVPGFRRVCEVPRRLALREDVARERLDALARAWLEPEPPDASLEPALARSVDWDFEPLAEHGWRGAARLVGAAGPDGGAWLTSDEAVTGTQTLRLTSPPFRIEFEELAFRLRRGGVAATPRREPRVELLVNGLPVLARTLGTPGETEDVRWPVHAWRGARARLSIFDASQPAWLALDDVRSVQKRTAGALDDFESAAYGERWAETFADAPVDYARTADALGLQFVLGRATASSLGVRGATRLVSAPFVVEHDELALVAQCFADGAARVELRVDGELVQAFAPEGEPALHALALDLAPYRGRSAVLAAYDDDPDPGRGIGLDALEFFDRE